MIIRCEPTTLLDDAAVYRAIRTAGSDRTVLMATHRMTDLQWVDRIFVMERGSVVEQGGFSELLTRGGPFTSLYESQIGTGCGKCLST